MKDDASLVVAIAVTVFLILGSGLTLIGTIGLVRLPTFYKRLHMLSLSTSWGAGSILVASFLYSIFVDHHFVFHEFLLVIFLLVTIPVASMLVSQAAAYRDYSENKLKKPLALLSRQMEKQTSTSEEMSCDTSQSDF
ncbi:monovalent cation/proton antiporter, MnhG/PhaG subunit [Bartonella elizabethae Re6043vi]|uniref:Monovalent cation/proton antiporter, MnhG/PhaG subunit n=2 Tax=Bartonella elizabethae TaxID=807 RepID=J0RDW8_BAREL|nr:monovalent cation/H(+) antiporter subunit G [Bartonella elizabethae]EJF83393.1 monovalent cation/proton antiporter, MnhG/PhaG subunit [Bartonella elizabethae Re6043vi]EJF96961.1 monovalent cation/proton antiporter, MnhG/PhaG subunit [Bartonella elizabethae F9251 = ATCC 49927]VEJ42130.1 Multiple resistance and pH homeostasis protein G [Bartonella elizabethae]